MRSPLAAFLFRRLVSAIAFVVVVSASAFVLVRVVPGDATTELFLSGADEATIARARARLGLDRSTLAQLGEWMSGLARLDLGRSAVYGREVRDLVLERAANTATLAAVTLVLATIIGLPLGLVTGGRPRSMATRVITPVSVALVACPPIVGALALLLLAVSTGWISPAPGSLVLPTLALALPLAATLERLQSQATTEALQSPDVAAAAARGVTPSRLLWIHTARQSLRPVLGVYGIIIGTLFSGSLAVEWITAWPGLGRLMYDALIGRDLYLVGGCAFAGAILIAMGNLAADLARAVIDPRVRDLEHA